METLPLTNGITPFNEHSIIYYARISKIKGTRIDIMLAWIYRDFGYCDDIEHLAKSIYLSYSI